MVKAELLGVGKDWDSLRLPLQYMNLAPINVFGWALRNVYTGMKGHIYACLSVRFFRWHITSYFPCICNVSSVLRFGTDNHFLAGAGFAVDHFLLSSLRRIYIGLIIALYACMPVEQ